MTVNPTAREIAEITLLAAEGVRRFGITPNAVLLGASNNIDSETKEGEKIQVALEWIRQHDPELMVDGKMRADAALTEELRQNLLPNSVLKGGANLLIMPNIEAAKIAYDLIKVLGDAITIGPVLLGLKQPAHIMTPSATVRRMINTSTIAVVDAQNRDEAKKEQELEKKTRETA